MERERAENFEMLLQHWQKLESDNQPQDSSINESDIEEALVCVDEDRNASEIPGSTGLFFTGDNVEEKEDRNNMRTEAVDNGLPQHVESENDFNSNPNWYDDSFSCNDRHHIESSSAPHQTEIASLPKGTQDQTQDGEHERFQHKTTVRKAFPRSPPPKFNDLKWLPSKISRALKKLINMKGQSLGSRQRPENSKVTVSYPVPATGHRDILIQAQEYRKTARTYHMQGGDLNTTLNLYESALNILDENNCSDGRYFGKVLFEYAVILSNAKRYREAAMCFLEADSLGVDPDVYYHRNN